MLGLHAGWSINNQKIIWLHVTMDNAMIFMVLIHILVSSGLILSVPPVMLITSMYQFHDY